MEIILIDNNRKKFLDLLLIGDEQESMIERYLGRGDLFALYDDGLKAVCVVTKEDAGVYEIKNISVYPEYHRMGYGKQLVEYISEYYNEGNMLLVGTGESPNTILFYEKCGFKYSHRIKNFFIDNYDHRMYDNGVLLEDMVYFKKQLYKPLVELYNDNDYGVLLKVWEASVRSTHDFLSEDDIKFYRNLIPSYFLQVDLYVIRNNSGEITSFMGLNEDMIEMLFVHPAHQGLGLGKALLNFAIQNKGVCKVDVNEQNRLAYQFYRHMGFEVTSRDSVDSENRPFPILHMKLSDA